MTGLAGSSSILYLPGLGEENECDCYSGIVRLLFSFCVWADPRRKEKSGLATPNYVTGSFFLTFAPPEMATIMQDWGSKQLPAKA